jgi:oligopeptide/dipeptide ABC transporter ATP-binding protein
MVMYAGRIVERVSSDTLFANPLHPYTQRLIATLPDPAKRVDRLPVIAGGVPDLSTGFQGCRFADRCPKGDAGCRAVEPPLEELAPGHFVACWKTGT